MTASTPTVDPKLEEPTEHDLGLKDAARVPLRTCVVTREVLPIENLIRFVKSPDGIVVPDIRRKLPGRGVWVQAKASIVEQAIKKNAFARGLKTNAKPAPELAQQVDDLLKHAAIDALKMANKAGAVICGTHAIELALPRGHFCALLHTADAAEDGKRKLDALFQRHNRNAAILSCLSDDDFHLVFGSSHAIHAAIVKNGVGSAVLDRLERWLNYRDYSQTKHLV